MTPHLPPNPTTMSDWRPQMMSGRDRSSLEFQLHWYRALDNYHRTTCPLREQNKRRVEQELKELING